MVKVLFLDHSSIVSGAEKSLSALVSQLIDKKVECWIACPKPEELQIVFPEQGTSFIKLTALDVLERDWNPAHLAKTLSQVFIGAIKIAQIARRNEVDIIHANSLACGVYASIARLLCDCKVLMHIRDMPQGAFTIQLVRRLVKYGVHKTIFVSKATARHYFPSEESNSNWVVIYNGIDIEDFFEQAERESLSFKESDTTMPEEQAVGMLGLLTPWKGYHVAIEAFADVLDVYLQASLWIVGSSDNTGYQYNLQKMVTKMGIEDQVFFPGFVQEVGAIIKNLSVLVSASVKPDPLPRVLLEGMALGIPIVAPKIGGIPEQITDGVNGFLFKPGNSKELAACICKVLENPDRARTMGTAGREIVKEKFSLSTHVNHVMSVYRSLLSEN